MNHSSRFSRHVLIVIGLVKEYIDSHPLEWKNTEELSAIAAINRNLLQKSFKLIYEVKISDYQMQKRMAEAAQMLEEGRLTKKQIASRCGYTRLNNFCKAFRKVYKMTPGEWQNGLAPISR